MADMTPFAGPFFFLRTSSPTETVPLTFSLNSLERIRRPSSLRLSSVLLITWPIIPRATGRVGRRPIPSRPRHAHRRTRHDSFDIGERNGIDLSV